VPVVVRKAHHEGLRVSAHVETAEDFRCAILAGSDEITHLPGWWTPQPEDIASARLTEKDADLAASARVVIVTTTVAGSLMPLHGGHAAQNHHRQGGDIHSYPSMHHSGGDMSARDVMKANLLLLHRRGARIVIGSDHAETSVAEALHLHELDVFDNLTLLKLWCENTPRAIFPDRHIGRLQERYEASFVVLAGNPLERFDNVTKVVLRVKQGHLLMR
jgi:imidazolonepropionase-like amidohydrolase